MRSAGTSDEFDQLRLYPYAMRDGELAEDSADVKFQQLTASLNDWNNPPYREDAAETKLE